jgi:hypothetical protein
MGVPDACALWRALIAVAGDRWREVAVAPQLHRTCPVNYSGAAAANSRGCQVPEPRLLGAPDTVRCATGQSGAPDQGAFRDAFSSLF